MTGTEIQKLMQDAAAHFQRGELPQAESVCEKILGHDPGQVPALNLLAGVYVRSERLQDAARVMEQVVQRAPQIPEFHFNHGDVLLRLGIVAAAEASFSKAIVLRPGYTKAWFHRGVTLEQLKQEKEAIVCYEKVLEVEPRNLGVILRIAHLSREARRNDQLRWAERALAIDPNNIQAMRYQASAFFNLGRLAEAIQAYRKIIALAPDDVSSHTALLMTLNYQTGVTATELRKEHEAWAANFTDPLRVEELPHANDPNPDRILRIGYVSSDFKDHAVGRFLKPVIANHDARNVEVFCYTTSTDTDAETLWYQQHCNGWRDISTRPRAEAAAMIRADAIDILVDLAGHTGTHRLDVFAVRPAPVQVTWLGYPCTTGVRAIDYLLTDSVLDPPGEEFHMTEKVERLPGAFCVFGEPAVQMPVSPLPAAANGYVTFGSMHNLLKLNDEVLDLWSEVLRRVAGSRLLIYRSALMLQAQAVLYERFAKRGLGKDRVICGHERPPSGSHFEVYHQMDIHLDCFPWNGHTTTCESLWMGVPSVTLLGDRHAGRMSATVYGQIGMDGLVATSKEEYVRIAAGLAGDLSRLARTRAELRKRMKQSPLMDAAQFARGLEGVYRSLWRRWAVAGA